MQGAIPILKLNRLDTHDRFEHVTKSGFSIDECCQDLIRKKPFGNHPFYIFAHTRTEPDGATKRLIWQPRLTKPEAQTNSILFKAYPGTDKVKIIWIIPDKNLWGQYERGLITENKLVTDSIRQFVTDKARLEAKEDDDLSDIEIDAIYKELAYEAKVKQAKEAASLSSTLAKPDPLPST